MVEQSVAPPFPKGVIINVLLPAGSPAESVSSSYSAEAYFCKLFLLSDLYIFLCLPLYYTGNQIFSTIPGILKQSLICIIIRKVFFALKTLFFLIFTFILSLSELLGQLESDVTLKHKNTATVIYICDCIHRLSNFVFTVCLETVIAFALLCTDFCISSQFIPECVSVPDH